VTEGRALHQSEPNKTDKISKTSETDKISKTSETGDLLLLSSIFLIAICALIYELIAGAVSSYLLGSSVTHFSLVIGLFLSAMGVGAYLTRFIEGELLERFVQIEMMIGLIGGTSSLSLFLAFTYAERLYMSVMVCVAGLIGALVGMEIPLIIRVLEERKGALKLTVANVMAVDYIGSLIASLAFPLIFVPYFGLMRTAFAFGLLNLAVAWVGIAKFRASFKRPQLNIALCALITALLTAGFIGSGQLVSLMEEKVYPDKVIYAKDSPFQRVILTHWKQDTRLFLNGALQFSSVDEHRYHEALVHPVMRRAKRHSDVLILGGGDGLAAREVFKHPQVQRVDLVDLDPAVTELFSRRENLIALNKGALNDPRLTIHNQDASRFLKASERSWDVVIIDLPDPESFDIGRLYSVEHFAEVSRRLRPGGVMVVQSTSPFFAREAFWCVGETLKHTPSVGPEGVGRLHVRPYHLNVPSFGEWGFILASASDQGLKAPSEQLSPLPETRFLTPKVEEAMFVFPKDLAQPEGIEVNRLNSQTLVRYYRNSYNQFYGDRP
jgi:spermidine synthase